MKQPSVTDLLQVKLKILFVYKQMGGKQSQISGTTKSLMVMKRSDLQCFAIYVKDCARNSNSNNSNYSANKKLLFNYSFSGVMFTKKTIAIKGNKVRAPTAKEVKICVLKNFAQALLCKKDICRYEIQVTARE